MLCFDRRCPGDFLLLCWGGLALCVRRRRLGCKGQRAVLDAIKHPLRVLRVPNKPARKAAADGHLRDMDHVLCTIFFLSYLFFFLAAALTSLMTKSISLVDIICPSSRFCSVPTRLTDLLAALTAIICCTISSSSASRKLASLAASSDVYSLRKLRSVGTAACARTSATNSAR
jgi:hypothetical protein